jgi:hypothetical protein
MGRLTTEKRPNLAMRWFIYLNGTKVFYVSDFGRIIFAASIECARGKFCTHSVVECSKKDTFMYLMFGEKVIGKIVPNIQKVTIENKAGYGEDTMKITFSNTGTRIKLNMNLVPKVMVSKLLEIIKYQKVTQTMRSSYIGISSILKPNYNVKLYSGKTKKVHIGNYNATENTITLIKGGHNGTSI